MKFLHLLTCLLLLSFFVDLSMAASGEGSFCNWKCKERCAKAGVQDRCIKYCGICCEKCHCVPSGTYGNKHECPCYAQMKNSKRKPKCP
ncbi:peamaclein-like [Momordica charantia]|uniref:Peamaclein-like n=1 Tax=Momordica charantia TaxID=3673 RepID=A0A6J1BV69_MOMCH|nr:peamaclein-like [Momordica charantia]